MSGQDYFSRRMAEISKPIDSENDPFSKLFSDETAEETYLKENQNPEVVDYNPEVVDQHPEVLNPEVLTGKSAAIRRLSQARANNRVQARSVDRSKLVTKNPIKKPEGVSLFLILPVAGVAILGTFFAGYYGGNFAGGKLSTEHAAAPVSATNVSQPKHQPIQHSTILPKRQIHRPSKKAVQQFAALNTGHKKHDAHEQQVVSNSVVLPKKPLAAAVSLPAGRATKPDSKGHVKQAAISHTAIAANPVNPQDQQARLLLDGHRLQQMRDYTGARAKFRHAFKAGASAAALALAQTYDQRSFSDDGAALKYSDANLAREWYEKWFLAALEEGSISPRARYDRLLNGLDNN